MHTVPLGILPIALGSALEEFAAEMVFGSFPGENKWKKLMHVQLRSAYVAFCGWARKHHIKCKVSAFSACVLSKSTEIYPPIMKVKARNFMYVADWLSEVAEAMAQCEPENVHATVRALNLWGHVRLWGLLHSGGSSSRKKEAATVREVGSASWHLQIRWQRRPVKAILRGGCCGRSITCCWGF
jgi:hypothetical protein